jgi:hypothetical protein
MVARGSCEPSEHAAPGAQMQKRGSPEKGEDTRSSTISVGPSGLKHYATRSRGCASLAPGYLISAPPAPSVRTLRWSNAAINVLYLIPRL